MRTLRAISILVWLFAPVAQAERATVDPAEVRSAVEDAFRDAAIPDANLEVLAHLLPAGEFSLQTGART